MDVHSPEQRSFNMSRIKGKNTKPEIRVRKWLWKNGYRYRLHATELPGKPDIVFRSRKILIFVHGCFWHRHGCKYSSTPKTNPDFWSAKFELNIRRDEKNLNILLSHEWHVLTLWECEIKNWNFLAEPKLKKFLLQFYDTDLNR